MSDSDSDEELQRAITLSKMELPVRTVQKFHSLPLMHPPKTSAKKNAPAAGTSRSFDVEQNVITSASGKTNVTLLPKKHPYIISKGPTKLKIMNIKETGLKQKPSVMAVIPGLPAKEFDKKCMVTEKKSRKRSIAASGKRPVKPAYQTGKKQSQKVSTSRASTSKSSRSQISTTAGSKSYDCEVLEGVSPKLVSKDTSSTSTSAGSNHKLPDSNFWYKMVETHFTRSEFNEILRENDFSESQANMLQRGFHLLSQELSNMIEVSHRFTRVHKCQDCDFSISHLCASIMFLRVRKLDVYMTTATMIEPGKTIICICNFAFLHAHTTVWHVETVKTVSAKPSTGKLIAYRDMKMGCPTCWTSITVERLHKDHVSKFKNWTAITSDNQKTFHTSLTDHMKTITSMPLSFQELYTCDYDCCLLFHCCARKLSAHPVKPM